MRRLLTGSAICAILCKLQYDAARYCSVHDRAWFPSPPHHDDVFLSRSKSRHKHLSSNKVVFISCLCSHAGKCRGRQRQKRCGAPRAVTSVRNQLIPTCPPYQISLFSACSFSAETTCTFNLCPYVYVDRYRVMRFSNTVRRVRHPGPKYGCHGRAMQIAEASQPFW